MRNVRFTLSLLLKTSGVVKGEPRAPSFFGAKKISVFSKIINVSSKLKAPASFLFYLKSYEFSKTIHLSVCPELSCTLVAVILVYMILVHIIPANLLFLQVFTVLSLDCLFSCLHRSVFRFQLYLTKKPAAHAFTLCADGTSYTVPPFGTQWTKPKPRVSPRRLFGEKLP